MGLLNAKCTRCGSCLEVDVHEVAAICPFCGEAFVVKKAIEFFYCDEDKFGEKQSTRINLEESLFKSLEERALSLEKLDDSFNAQKLWVEAIQKYPNNYKSWLGILPYSYTGHSGTGYKFLKVYENIMQLYGEIDDILKKEISDRLFYKAINHAGELTIDEWKIYLNIMPKIISEGQNKAQSLIFDRMNNEERLVLNHIMYQRIDYSSTTSVESFVAYAKNGQLSYPLERIDEVRYDIMLPCVIKDIYYYFSRPGICSMRIENIKSSIKKIENAYIIVNERQKRGVCMHCGERLSIWGKCKYCKC